MVDDLGYNDLYSFPTPTISYLADRGILLKNHYTAITCTPSRASFLTGNYPSTVGLSSALLYNNPYGLDNYVTLPKVLQSVGYDTSLIGKWHLGYAKKDYLPTSNGFNNFYGTLNGASDHYTKKLNNINDLYSNNKPIINYTYSTELYTDVALKYLNKNFMTMISYQAVHTPLQVPQKYLLNCNMTNYFRKLYCGMMVAIDESIKKITDEIKKKGLWDETIILFTTDNGGQPWFGALNYPFRGTKNSLYEGGCRGIAFLSGGYIKNQHIYYGNIHISDWFSTFLSMLKINNNYRVDGMDLSYEILNNKKSKRNNILIHNDIYSNTYSYILDNWKIIVGNSGDSTLFMNYDNKKCPVNNNYIDLIVCYFMNDMEIDNSHDVLYYELIREIRNIINGESIGSDILFGMNNSHKIELYNLLEDPYEQKNVAQDYPFIVNKLLNYRKINKQFKWYISDSNVKILKNNYSSYGVWINNDDYKVKENNFLRKYLFVLIKKYLFVLIILIIIYLKNR
jgi:arylsulfatase A-like enzyme